MQPRTHETTDRYGEATRRLAEAQDRHARELEDAQRRAAERVREREAEHRGAALIAASEAWEP